MNPKLQKTFTPGPDDVTREWHLVDADGVPLGRLASRVAQLLRGKHKPTFAPHFDGGDFVVIINAEKIAVTGTKELTKTYYRHSGYPGGLKALTLAQMRARFPERIIESAVRGMLPKNRLGRRIIGKLKVYAGPDHPHAAQAPRPLDMGRSLDEGKKVGA